MHLQQVMPPMCHVHRFHKSQFIHIKDSLGLFSFGIKEFSTQYKLAVSQPPADVITVR